MIQGVLLRGAAPEGGGGGGGGEEVRRRSPSPSRAALLTPLLPLLLPLQAINTSTADVAWTYALAHGADSVELTPHPMSASLTVVATYGER